MYTYCTYISRRIGNHLRRKGICVHHLYHINSCAGYCPVRCCLSAVAMISSKTSCLSRDLHAACCKSRIWVLPLVIKLVRFGSHLLILKKKTDTTRVMSVTMSPDATVVSLRVLLAF